MSLEMLQRQLTRDRNYGTVPKTRKVDTMQCRLRVSRVKRKKPTGKQWARFSLVGGTGIEPVTPAV